MAVYGYCRVSTREQAEGGESLTTQERTIRGYAMMKGWDIAAMFIEGGVSGSIAFAERPEGKKLVATLRFRDVLITPKMDRMFRNAADALVTLQSLRDDGVALHMIDLGGDVTNNGVSKLVFTILAAVAENERDRIRERIREVKQDMKKRGRYSGGKRPYGWNVIDGELVPNPDEQAAINAMLEMRQLGQSFREIGRHVELPPMTVKRILDRFERARGLNEAG